MLSKERVGIMNKLVLYGSTSKVDLNKKILDLGSAR